MSVFLPRVRPAQVGVDPAGVRAFIDAAERNGLHSFMLVRHGKVAAEGFWKPFAPEYTHMLFSLSKSFTSTAVGFAVQEGLLSVEDRLVDFFPEYFDTPPEGYLAEMRLRHLLTMSTGHTTAPSVLVDVISDDWCRNFFTSPLPNAPGTRFLYNTAATYMLSAVVTKVSGLSVRDYLQPRLFAPLGIENVYWESCPKGITAGGFGLNLKTEDLAKFGLLYLNRGKWEGRQLLSAAWVDEATAWHVPNFGNVPDWRSGYGYQFWRCSRPGVYRGDGAYGQLCVVLPGFDAVFVCTGNIGSFQVAMDDIYTYLSPAMQAEYLSEDAAAQSEMERRLAELTLPFSSGNASYRDAKATLTLSGAPYGLQKLTFAFGGDKDRITIVDSCGEYTLSAGHGCWIEGKTAYRQCNDSEQAILEDVAVQGAWDDDHTYRFTVQYTRSPMADRWVIRFGENGAAISLDKSGCVIGGSYAFLGNAFLGNANTETRR